jgi:hypothetical protein
MDVDAFGDVRDGFASDLGCVGIALLANQVVVGHFRFSLATEPEGLITPGLLPIIPIALAA